MRNQGDVELDVARGGTGTLWLRMEDMIKSAAAARPAIPPHLIFDDMITLLASSGLVRIGKCFFLLVVLAREVLRTGDDDHQDRHDGPYQGQQPRLAK